MEQDFKLSAGLTVHDAASSLSVLASRHGRALPTLMSMKGRPPCLPAALHRAMPAFTRSRLIECSNSANAHHRYCRRTIMRLDDHFGSSSTVQRNERVKLAASFWNNVGASMVFGGMAGAFFLEKPPGAWPKIGIAFAGLVLGWLCYSIASNILTYLHTAPDERR